MKKHLLFFLLSSAFASNQVEFFSSSASKDCLSDIVISSAIAGLIGFVSQAISNTKSDKALSSLYGLAATNMLVALQPKYKNINPKISVISINTNGDCNKFSPQAFYFPYYNSKTHLIVTLAAFAIGSCAGFLYKESKK